MRYHWETLLRAMRFVYANFACRIHKLYAFWLSRASLVGASSERTQSGYDGAGIASLIFIRFSSRREITFFLIFFRARILLSFKKWSCKNVTSRCIFRVIFFLKTARIAVRVSPKFILIYKQEASRFFSLTIIQKMSLRKNWRQKFLLFINCAIFLA